MFHQDGKGVKVAKIRVLKERIASFKSCRMGAEAHGETLSPVLTFDARDDTDSSPVSLPPGVVFDPLPVSLSSKEQDRDVHYLSGRGGSGKSYYSAGLIEKYRKAGYDVFVITDIPDKKFEPCTYLNINDFVSIGGKYDSDLRTYRKKMLAFRRIKKDLEPEDADELELALMDLKPKESEKKRIELAYKDEDLAELFHKSVVLFDDYENNENIKLISFFRDNLLTKSRHFKCSLIICNHSTNFGNGSKLIMGETSNFVLFSKSTPHSREYFLSKHLGWKPVDIAKVERALKKSRWVNIDRDLDICISQNKAWQV